MPRSFPEWYESPNIQGWMTPGELQWLYEQAHRMNSIIEIGSWKGRSTHALCTGTPGIVTAVDHFQGTPGQGKEMDVEGNEVYKKFLENMRDVHNLIIKRMSSLEAAEHYRKEPSFDMVFIDAGHTFEAVQADIRAWRPRAAKLLCGHDYHPAWPGVVQAVNEEIGFGNFQTFENIWFVNLDQEAERS